MTMVESTTDPTRRAFEFRQLVALVLQVNDVPAQARQPRPTKLSERLQQPRDPSDVLGVSNWVIRTFTAQARDLARGMDEAKAAAEEAGVEHFAAVWKRPRRAAQDSYVVMPLNQFAALVAQAQKDSDEDPKQDL
jgi:hypothetical protein